MPLTLTTAITEWRPDLAALVVAGALTAVYVRSTRRAAHAGLPIAAVRQVSFLALGVGVFVVATCSFVGTYADVLFWVRCLQVVLLLMVVPFGLAMGRPLTALRDGAGVRGRDRIDRLLAHRVTRVISHPATTSIMMIFTPWLLFLTPWLHAVLVDGAIDFVTCLALVGVGFLYFYARLQADPVPHRYSQLISLVITIAEMLGDGVLGIVLWLGPLIQPEYYAGVGRTWGPSPVTDQIIGAGVFWILGDVLGMPFLFALLRAFRLDEKVKSDQVDAELDAEQPHTSDPETGPASAPGSPWWVNDPQLQDRFRRS